MATQKPRFRFAPSPNGELHLGHAYSALVTWQLAKRIGGEVLLRIEDIDTGRSRQRYVDGIKEDLAWLGLTWSTPVRRQSEHFADYRDAAKRLRKLDLLYPSTATRKQIAGAVAHLEDWPTDPDGAPLFPGGDHLPCDGAVGQVALRLDMVRAMKCAQGIRPLQVNEWEASGEKKVRALNPSEWGDAVIVRKDTPTSYHLSVVVDDAIQGITHVTRGQDLEAATSLHVLLQLLLGLPTPVYHHHKLIAGSSGKKLSKSLRDVSLTRLRQNGWVPEDVYAAVGLAAFKED